MAENNTDLRETHLLGWETREQIVDQQACPALSFYGIRMAGISDTAAPFCFVRHQPRMSQVLVCLSGHGLVLRDGLWARCETGMAYLTPPGVTHGYKAGEGGRWKFGWVIYEGGTSGTHIMSAPQPALTTVEVQPLADAILGLYREALHPAEPALLHHWTHLVHRYAERVAGPGSGDRRLSALWEQVDGRLSHAWNVAEMAERAGISGEHLRRLCQEERGCSPMRHVTALRMRRAAALLASEAFTVESVAAQVGYENAFAFSTAFKRHTGLSPSEYRTQR